VDWDFHNCGDYRSISVVFVECDDPPENAILIEPSGYSEANIDSLFEAAPGEVTISEDKLLDGYKSVMQGLGDLGVRPEDATRVTALLRPYVGRILVLIGQLATSEDEQPCK
jgi:hypothetical protein